MIPWLSKLVHQKILTPIRLRAALTRHARRLEIGPGDTRLPGFETLSFVAAPNVDYVADASSRLPFDDDVFEMVFASHVLEHIPWFDTRRTVREWTRLVKPGGTLEIWVPDGLKLCALMCDLDADRDRTEWEDGWQPAKPINDAFEWVNARLLYGARDDYPSWHRAILTPSHLRQILEGAGLVDISILPPGNYRTVDHGWINLGIRGKKP